MDREFGLIRGQLEARFFTMQPKPGEDSASFVVRVEQARRGVGAHAVATLHCFLPRLSSATRRHLEQVRRTKATLGGASGLGGTLEWEEVVAMARDALLHNEVDKEAPAVVAQEAPSPPAVAAPAP